MHAEYTFITIRNRFQAGVTKFNHAYILPEAFKGAFKAIRMHSPENAIFLKLTIPRYMLGELMSLSL